MSQMPDIKPEVNKVDDGSDRKKGSGLLGSLFGGGGAGSGAAGGLGGAAAGGGLLATKAGMIALVVIGTAVAGGIGLAGYSAFGPGAADKSGANLSLFAPKPKEADPNAPAPLAKDGSSASLNYLAQAAAKDKAADAPPASGEAAPADQTAGDAAASASGDGKPAGDAPINSGDALGGSASKASSLQGVKKLGELSKSTGGGASSSASAGVKGGPGSLLDGVNAARGSVGGGVGNAGLASGGRRAAAGRRSTSARRQLASVMRDQRGATTSAGAGRTYDGSAATTGEVGPEGGAIGLGGTGAGTGTQATSMPNSAPNVNEYEPPTPKAKAYITPWQKAIAQIQMLAMLAVGLMLAATMIPADWTYLKAIKIAIGVAIIAIGGYMAYLAGQVMSGKEGQVLQGSVAMAAALGTMVAGLGVILDSGTGAAKDATMMQSLGNASGLILFGGGAAALAGIGLMFTPKPKPIEVEKGKEGDYDIGYYQQVKEPTYEIRRIG
jgi:hypothetical protein